MKSKVDKGLIESALESILRVEIEEINSAMDKEDVSLSKIYLDEFLITIDSYKDFTNRDFYEEYKSLYEGLLEEHNRRFYK